MVKEDIERLGITSKDELRSAIILISCILGAIVICLFSSCNVQPVRAAEIEYSNEEIADAIYYAEGGAKTRHPYGILIKYKTTTPRQACLNTIKNQRIRHSNHICGKDFLTCLRDRYCQIGASNDPSGLNSNWLKNVKRLLAKNMEGIE